MEIHKRSDGKYWKWNGEKWLGPCETAAEALRKRA
jgi:hypothetical protein